MARWGRLCSDSLTVDTGEVERHLCAQTQEGPVPTPRSPAVQPAGSWPCLSVLWLLTQDGVNTELGSQAGLGKRMLMTHRVCCPPAHLSWEV